ncbi:MAG: UDP-N-acetylglucosamine 1-carboxyvinyltransferase [Clostridia bacterium]|nr:UDP-N-acetylglucosamine 1-carboxyvinyltransferase [Clostridia bacterium]
MENKDFFLIKKCDGLRGEVSISGCKNAALPIMAATLLSGGKTTLKNVPMLSDIRNMSEILTCFGASITQKNKNELIIDTENILHTIAPYDLTCKLRGSFLVMGPMLARMKKVRLSLPGGCPIGSRPVDLHLKGFAALGATITKGAGFVEVKAEELIGTKIYLDFPSVGATENILMAATLAKGKTTIENAAAEPEIADLANFLNKMGARITGAGTDTITVNGVDKLKGIKYSIMPDRIEAGTFMIASAMTNGDVLIKDIIPEHIKPLTAKLLEMGADLEITNDTIRVRADKICTAKDVKTLPFPGFPTDMQAQMTALLSLSKGTGIVTETIFENRFMHVAELCRMGAQIKVEGHCAVVEGKRSLSGTKVSASDLRAGAALVLAGLAAKGQTQVFNIHHIDRGYENLDIKLKNLGAQIERIERTPLQ